MNLHGSDKNGKFMKSACTGTSKKNPGEREVTKKYKCMKYLRKMKTTGMEEQT